MKLFRVIILLLIPIVFSGCMGCTVVNSGYRGVKLVFGKAEQSSLEEGIYFYNPLSTSIIHMSVREERNDVDVDAYTKDTQKVKIQGSVTFYPDKTKMHSFYETLGNEWSTKVVDPAVLGTIKDVIGKIVADDLVSNRGKAASEIESELRDKLTKRSITLTKFEMTGLGFEKQYEHAVESKVVAIQKASESKNRTVQIRQEAEQQVISAKAEAESMKIRSQALKENKGLVEYEAVQKWNGKLPEIMGVGPLPFLNLDKRNK